MDFFFNGSTQIYIHVERNVSGQYGSKRNPHPPHSKTRRPLCLDIQELCKWGGKIFDPMMGSQSSRIAAYYAGLDYYGCEIDKEYFDKGCERFDKECHGIIKQKDGTTIQQLTLF